MTTRHDIRGADSPYRMSTTEFERRVSVPPEDRRESTAPPVVSSTLNGDEAAMLHWNSGACVPGAAGGQGDGDGD